MSSKPGFLSSITRRILQSPLGKEIRAQMSVWVENDTTFLQGSRSWSVNERDRYDSDRETLLLDALEAWRLNPLARRIVGLTTQYVVGGGISVGSKHEGTNKFINDFWRHRLNRMGVRSYEMCDELTRTGNIFLLISTGADGMSYIRPFPASYIDKIDAKENDVEQPVRFWPKAGDINHRDAEAQRGDGEDLFNPAAYPAYDEDTDERNTDGSFRTVMVQYTINRPVGGQWGESDLAPVLKWLSRYSNWLEDRARLNRFRNSFVFVVKSKFLSEADRVTRQNNLAAHPPNPGSILVCDESETWEVLSPKLESSDANTDGLALKKMVASGAGIPMHFLAEPEGSTRTTAEAAGGPTFRHFEQRQNYFIWLIEDLLHIVIARRAMVSGHVSARAEVEVRGADISARDNVSLSMAGQNIVNLLSDLRDRQLITDEEYLRLAYRFAGEVVDVEDMLAKAAKAGPPMKWAAPVQKSTVAGADAAGAESKDIDPGRPAGVTKKRGGGASKIDAETGDLKPGAEGMGAMG